MKIRFDSGRLQALVTVALCGAFFGRPLLYAQAEQPGVGMTEVYRNFQTPPPGYSMVPLFRLNDKVDRNELSWQFQELKSQGVGGAFILPESMPYPFFPWKDAGMPYKYLSPEYFQVAREFAEEAKRAGVDLWVYDEVDWPSGVAGGEVVANPAYQSKVIKEAVSDYDGPQTIHLDVKPDAGLVAVEAYRWDGKRVEPGSIQDLTHQVSGNRLEWSVPEGKWQIAVYSLDPNPGLYGHADADLLNADAMKEFIHLTHAQYEEQVEKPTGVRINGTFTDEPHLAAFRNYIGNLPGVVYLPWSAELEKTFQESKGYDFKAYLPLLYLDGGPETAKVRCDFWEVVSTMFEKNYFGQIAQFDHRAGWISTGHLNGEEDFWWHLVFDGGNEFANQRQLDYPGLDWILPFDYTPDYGIGWLDPFAGKFVSSAAHVYSKRRVMEETFAAAGWGISFEQMHRMVNWAYVLGVNMLVPITYKYSLRGADRATSYPPGISYQQPWWSEMRPFSDYVSRLSYLLSQGQYKSQIAFLLPVPDVWANSQDREHVEDLNLKVHWATNGLLRHGYDFDFIDDDSLRGALLQNGKILIGGNRYEALILPPVRVVSAKTMDKVAEFSRGGGKVIALDRLPTGSMEKGDPDPAVEATLKGIFPDSLSRRSSAVKLVSLDQSAETLIEALNHVLTRPMALQGSADGIYSLHRAVGSSDIFFLINSTEEEREFDAVFKLRGSPELWDPETGARSSIPGLEARNGERKAHLLLRPYEGLFIVFNSGLAPAAPRRWWNQPDSALNLTGTWDFKLEPTMTDPHLAWNFSPLSEGWKLKGGDYSGIHEMTLGNWMNRGLPYYSGKATYEKAFDFGPLKSDQRYLLDLGKVGIAARVWLNGKLVGSRLWKPYTFDITDFLQAGQNMLQVSVVNTLANYYAQFDQLKDAPLYMGGNQPWMLPSGLMGPVEIRGYVK
jgi:hypothetical protein